MDLISSIRKEGSRGGVNFSWSDVTTSQHRENYLGHSVMAPVGRWQKGKDLTWYAKGDHAAGIDGESAEERKVRERKEEIRRIKEAEEDALAKALGLPVKERNVTGSNRITVAEVDRAVKEAAVGEDNEAGSGNAFGDFVGMIKDTQVDFEPMKEELEGGLARKDRERRGRSRSPSRERKNRRHRRRSRSGERRRPRSRSGDRYQRHRRDAYRDERRPRSRDVDRARRRQRSRSPDNHRGRLKRSDYDDCRERSRRSISLDSRDRRRRRKDGEWRR